MLSIEEIRTYCLNKPGVTEGFPFDSDTLVFNVAEKLFLLTNLENATTINLKCEPERAIQLRELYPEIIPGYHMNKKHWNTVSIQGSLTNTMLFELIDHSYTQVVSKLPKSIRGGLSIG